MGALLTLIALDAAARFAATRWALAQVRGEAEAAAGFRAAMLRSEIEKQRTLPLVLAQDPDVRAVLRTRDPASLADLDAKLESLADGTRAAVIYVLDAKGVAIAASNYRLPTTFVGSDYSFRPYFLKAIADGSAEHFALGTVSRRPGLYITRRIEDAAGPVGVVVVKAEFEALETDWQSAGTPTYVTDPRDIVLITNMPDWRFRTTVPIAPERRGALRSSLQFGDASLDLLPLRPAGSAEGLVAWPEANGGTQFIETRTSVPTTGWTLHVLAPFSRPAGLVTLAARSIALLIGLLALGTIAFLSMRRRALKAERRREAGMRAELEANVAARTAELSDANAQLLREIEERRRAEAGRQRMQDDLVQASKLAVLGQIAASVAHEVNQPVAAIRTFAESGTALIARGEIAMAEDNFATIAALTDRIGAITGELRAFSRKSAGEVGAVSLRDAIDGALLLVRHRLRQGSIDLALGMPEEDIRVAAERGRLEQVFVNLLQNAIEALAGRNDGRIQLTVRVEPEAVAVIVADNGPGMAPSVLENLFMPFTTTKPEGLGLGLVISHDILAEFGGGFEARNQDGAVFTLTLRRIV
ncbi:sensor histidine kinase [Kaistia algarum]|uniref:sensor histidine kinase n=1 Tax=Kaistia algarum TaxID=2083279 RepID=UPI0022536EB8|nr:ATP-binding protein [Kaistia algarum]